MAAINSVGSGSGTILTRQQDLTDQRGQNAAAVATAEARSNGTTLQRGERPEQNQDVTNRPSQNRPPNVTNESSLRDTTGASTPAKEQPATERPATERTKSSDVRVSDILNQAAEEGRNAQAQQVEAATNNQPVAESEVGGTINVRV